jgi:hypothetical protein
MSDCDMMTPVKMYRRSVGMPIRHVSISDWSYHSTKILSSGPSRREFALIEPIRVCKLASTEDTRSHTGRRSSDEW